MRIIDADALIDKLMNAIECGRRADMPTQELEAVLSDVRNAPTIEPRRGEWTPIGDEHHRCSNCERTYNNLFIPQTWNYCPNCGARMKGADDE